MLRRDHTLCAMKRINGNRIWLSLVVTLILLVPSALAFSDASALATGDDTVAAQPHPTPDPHP